MEEGWNCYIFDCGLSFKNNPLINNGYTTTNLPKIKSIKDCEYLLSNHVFNCKGKPFLRSNVKNVFIRQHIYKRKEMAIISKSLPKITQKKVREVVENIWGYEKIKEGK